MKITSILTSILCGSFASALERRAFWDEALHFKRTEYTDRAENRITTTTRVDMNFGASDSRGRACKITPPCSRAESADAQRIGAPGFNDGLSSCGESALPTMRGNRDQTTTHSRWPYSSGWKEAGGWREKLAIRMKAWRLGRGSWEAGEERRWRVESAGRRAIPVGGEDGGDGAGGETH